MTMAEHTRIIVATVRKPHGVKGGLKASLHGIELIDLHPVKLLFVKNESGWQSFTVTQIQGTDAEPIIYLEGITSREDAETFRGQELWADEDDLPPLEDFEFYVEDLEGCDVYDSEGVYFGKVTQVILNPEQDILEVRDEDGSENLFPFVEEWVESVDLAAKRVTVIPSEMR